MNALKSVFNAFWEKFLIKEWFLYTKRNFTVGFIYKAIFLAKQINEWKFLVQFMMTQINSNHMQKQHSEAFAFHVKLLRFNFHLKALKFRKVVGQRSHEFSHYHLLQIKFIFVQFFTIFSHFARSSLSLRLTRQWSHEICTCTVATQ
jgi:hypothetical protein